jgi:DNA-binding NarL/FixJ family response regulator
MKRISILLAEDHTVVREGIRNLLQLESDIEVAGEARDGREAVAMAASLCPDVILMDIGMPNLNGLEATRQILAATPTARILILSAHGEDAYVQGAVDAGALGFLLKDISANEVCRAIRVVYQGKTYCSPQVAKRLKHLRQQSVGRKRTPRNRASLLTRRESEVLQLVAEGKANKETAADLGISIKTVEKHRASLMEKLNIHDTAGLTRFALSEGIVEGLVRVTIV